MSPPTDEQPTDDDRRYDTISIRSPFFGLLDGHSSLPLASSRYASALSRQACGFVRPVRYCTAADPLSYYCIACTQAVGQPSKRWLHRSSSACSLLFSRRRPLVVVRWSRGALRGRDGNPESLRGKIFQTRALRVAKKWPMMTASAKAAALRS